MPYEDIEESRLYQRAERLADVIWNTVIAWNEFAKDTVGKQLARAADSVGANIAESAGRFHPGDVVRFLYYARGSLRETRYWLKRSKVRELISSEFFDEQMSELNALGAELNSYIGYQKKRTVKEDSTEYRITVDVDKPTNKPAD